MKKYLSFVLFAGLLFFCFDSSAQFIPNIFKGNVIDFESDSEERIKQWEDSIKKVLYPEPIVKVSEIPLSAQKSTRSTSTRYMEAPNNYVKNYYEIDKSKDVGEIPLISSFSPSGAVTYTVPIVTAPGVNGSQPQLSLNYNNQGGNGVLGMGWSLGGLSGISRVARNIYYDNNQQGITLTKSDAFVLDGMRLIRTGGSTSQIDFETEQGRIKVKAILSGEVIRYFEVKYPNGSTAVFGKRTNYSNLLSYPLSSISDMNGNIINYDYSYVNNRHKLNKITYGSCSIDFLYKTGMRSDPIVSYEAGRQITEDLLLEKIQCKSDNGTLRVYSLTYGWKNGSSILTQIDCSALTKALPPLRFFYGEGNTSVSFSKAETQLIHWYTGVNPWQLTVSKGKFDYGTDNDGLISLPYKNPYWYYFRNKTWFRKQHNQYQNQYNGTEKIFIYAGLSGTTADAMPNLVTEAGFTDVFCANVDGKYEEEVVKVNNTVSGDKDCLQFKVYGVNLYTGLATKYTRTFYFSTMLQDHDNNKSVHPKFHFTGDFNGDGKIEILSVSNNHPFGWTDKPGHCYLFDLDANRILYQGSPFAFHKDFVGTRQGDPAIAEQNSDKLFVFDYDGDGKTDICLINQEGTHIYTFDKNGSYMTPRKVATYTGLKRSDLEGKLLLMGEFNGDGKPDFLLSPRVNSSDWRIYYARGDGQFDSFGISITRRLDNHSFLCQDVNSDGLTDVIEKKDSGFYTYLARPNRAFSYVSYTSFGGEFSNPVFVPTDINSRYHFSQLIALKDGKVARFSYGCNETKEKLLTGAVSSFGVVSKNYYRMLNEDYHINYTQGYGAVYPYENFKGSLFVPVVMEQYVNGQRTEYRNMSYGNAVIHKQGRGFCGFGKIASYDNIRGISSVQEFDPYNFGILKSEDTHLAKNTNTWKVDVLSNKIARITLSGSTSYDKLTEKSRAATYLYDAYGNPTQETIDYGDGITTVTATTYYNNVTNQGTYLIGQPLVKTVTSTRGGNSWVNKEAITYNTARLPETRITYTGVNGTDKTGETRWTYDTATGNVTGKKSAPYNVTELLGTTYTYDSSGRYVATAKDPLGQTTTYSDYDGYGNARTITDNKNRATTRTFDAWGQPVSTTHPDGVVETVTPAWDGQGVYTVTKTVTGQPTTVVHYDAVGRELRKGSRRFDGSWQYVDNAYDSKGRLEKVSLPFKGSSPSHWNTYTYDTYNRPTRITEASGKTATWSYNGLSVTETKNGIATTKTTDVSGALVSVSDPGGTITYTLRPDGQPSKITAPGGVVTSFGYDHFGKQTSITDPSAGTQTFTDVYNIAGWLFRTVKDATGKAVTTTYNKFGQIEKVTRPEFTTSYKYKEDDKEVLEYESSTNGTRTDFEYDTYGRIKKVKETVPDGKWLQKTYTYASGNVSSVQYTSQNGNIGTESFMYAHGHNTEIKWGTTSIWKLTEENALGQPTKATTGSLQRTYGYTAFGMPTGRTAGSIQNFSYNFDVQKGNLLSRKDNTRNKTETFGYDNLNRLSSMGNQTISYAANGNITQMPGVGTLAYENTAKPYQVTMLTPTGTAVPARQQTVTYTSFQRPATITENGITGSFTYNAGGDRAKFLLNNNGTITLSRYYIGKQYELDVENDIERLYLGGDAYSAPAVYLKEANVWKIYYICRDYLGSITHIANADGSLKQELSYDAWGRLRHPATHVAYTPGNEPVSFLRRGYTGHEHHYWFGLINMNARLYDPALGRFLSPDPYVQMPDFTQNFNRYSYCLNNPLIYVDENGEFVHLIIGAVVGGVANVISNWKTIKEKGFWTGLGYFAVGAGVGTLSAAGGAWAATTFKAVGVFAGAGVGALSGGVIGGGSSFLLNGGNNVLSGRNFLDNWKSNVISGVIGGAVSGAIGGGIKGYNRAKDLGANRWTGKKVYSEKTYNATIKTGIAAQSDPNKHCYSVADEYASSGRENFSRFDFQNQALGADGADPLEIYKSKTGKDIFKINNWDIVGKELSNNSAEIMGVISQNGTTNHAVNVVGFTVENRLKLFGGGVKQIVKSVVFWDPAIGTTTSGHTNFLKIGYFKY